MILRDKSIELYSLACEVIPGGVNSPVRSFSSLGITPLIVERGEGDTIWDVDGRSYIDYCGSWGALILGHAPKSVCEAVLNQLHKGSSFGISTPLEERLARKIINHYPSVEKIRFVSSGTEAVMSAVRLARGYTGKNRIVKFDGNYHGHADGFLVKAGSFERGRSFSKGVPSESVSQTISLPYNELVDLDLSDVAAIIVEPIAGNMGVVPGSIDFLKDLREKDVLLIFDEVITGFRVGLRGAQGLYGIKPDLTCFGKIIGGGLPAAAFGGRGEIMNELAPLGKVFQAGTLSGNPLAMSAGIATINEIEQPGFYEELDKKMDLLLKPIEEWIHENHYPACIQRAGSMFTLFLGPKEVRSQKDLEFLDHEKFQVFFKFLFERGIYLSPAPNEASFISSAHTLEHLEKTRELILEFLNNDIF